MRLRVFIRGYVTLYAPQSTVPSVTAAAYDQASVSSLYLRTVSLY